GADGSVVQSSNVVKPPDFEALSGSLYSGRETVSPIEPGVQNLKVPAHSEQGIASVEIIAGESTIVSEQHCAQEPEVKGVECQKVSDEWVVETGELEPGIMQIEALIEDSEQHVASKRFWVNIPYTPPPNPEEPKRPTFAEVKTFREAYGLD